MCLSTLTTKPSIVKILKKGYNNTPLLSCSNKIFDECDILTLICQLMKFSLHTGSQDEKVIFFLMIVYSFTVGT